jgi:hypothetical protein
VIILSDTRPRIADVCEEKQVKGFEWLNSGYGTGHLRCQKSQDNDWNQCGKQKSEATFHSDLRVGLEVITDNEKKGYRKV